MDDLALLELQTLLAGMATELGLDLHLAAYGGAAVVVDAQLTRAISPQMLEAFCEERPLLTLEREPAAPDQLRGAIRRASLRADVLALAQDVQWQQLLELQASWPKAVVEAPPYQSPASERQASNDEEAALSGYDSSFDSRYPGDALADAPADTFSMQFLNALHHGKSDPELAPLIAQYEGGAMMVVDFAQGRVLLEPEAWTELRLARRLPSLAAGVTPRRGMQERELDLALWDFGRAAGAYPLLFAPADWWHRPLVPVALQIMARYSSVPLHLEMARLLSRGGVTPSQLRRECRVGLRELRGFLQACSFLYLLYWQTGTDHDAPQLATHR